MTKGCDTDFGLWTDLWVTPASVKLTGEFNLALIKGLQKEGKLDVIKGILTFSEVGTDKIYETLDSNQDLLAGKAVYRYDLVFNKGEYFNKALTYLSGTGKRVYMVDGNGNIRLADNGEPQGFKASLITNNKMTLRSNTEGAKQSLKIQLEDANEFEQTAVVIRYDSDVMDFNPATLEDKTQAFLKLGAVADGDTDLSFEVLVDRGRSTNIVGLTEADMFKVTINGVETTATATLTGDTYSLSGLTIASGDVVKVGLNGVVETADGELYCSNEASVTVA